MADYYSMVPKGFDANLAFRKECLEMAGRDRGAARELKGMCASDMLFYVNAFCWTYDPRNEARKLPAVVPFITYPFQDRAMLAMQECVETGRDFAVPKSRDMGASWMGLSVFEWFWHFRANLSFLLISRNEDYVDKSGNPKALFWKIDFLHKNQPRWLLPAGRELGGRDPNRRLLHLGNAENGSVIDGESTTGDAGRGDRRTAMFIDEHAAFDINDGFRVLRASRDTTNCRGFNSTPQGANNAFYEVCHNTSAKVIRLHWSEHPVKAIGLYRGMKDGGIEHLDDFSGDVSVRTKGEKEPRTVRYPEDYPYVRDGRLRSPWYDDQCARCTSEQEIAQELDIDFAGSDFQFFDSESINLFRKRDCRPPDLVGDLEYDAESCEPKRFVENPKGHLHLWLPLGRDGRPPVDCRYVMGADVSAGSGASNSVASIADKKTGEKIAVWRDSKTAPNRFARQAIALAKWFNNALMCWDASGPTGMVFTKRVLEACYPNIYYRKNVKKVGNLITREAGYYLNPAAKTSLFEDYREALADRKFINRSDQGLKECLQFIRKSDGTIEHSEAMNTQDPSGARTAHGDEVVADALCSLVLVDSTTRSESEKPEILEMSLAWRMQMRERDRLKATGTDGLGEGW